MTDDLLGQQLDEYRLLALLGKGGMARVYLGVDVPLKRYVSIKVIDTPYRTDPGYVQRFQREAQAVARLEHPHIVRLYRYGQAGGLLYMAMQYIEGADLESILEGYRKAGQFIPPAEATRVVQEVCQALDYAHARGVIHRDIKTSNILVDRQGQAYLTDFGLALFAEPLASEDHFGTPQYMAPEQVISPTGAVPQSDLYGLAVVLYEMFTGQLPFNAPDPMQVAASQVNDAPRPPRRLRPELSPSLEAAILKGMAKDPADRYPNGAALAEAVTRALSAPQGMPVTPLHLTVRERVTAEMDRLPLPPPGSVRPGGRGIVPQGTAAIPRHPPRPGAVPVRRSLRVPAPQRVRRRKSRRGCVVAAILVLLAALLALAGLLLAYPRVFGFQVWLPSLVNGTTEAMATATGPATPTEAPPPPTVEPSPTPEVIPTEEPSATPEPSLTPTATPPGPAWAIEIVTDGDNTLVLVNRGVEAFPLPRLILGEGEGAIDGSEWGLRRLASGACVSAAKATGRQRLPPFGCVSMAPPVMRDPPNVPWKSDFTIFFDGQPVGQCPQQGCRIEIPIVE